MRLIILAALLFFAPFLNAQQSLKPGFDAGEFLTLLQITARQTDTPWTKVQLPYPEGFNLDYRSEVTGLDNRWDLWYHPQRKLAVISLRATINTSTSWLANLYAGMLPATGSIQTDSVNTFHYKLADDSMAYVHAGWLLALAYMAPAITEKIKEYIDKGVKDYIIVGHSQGGALAFLTDSYLAYSGIVPEDVRIKTYCSAAPKPGNLYFAYDFEQRNQAGWAFRVVNRKDWVPEAPVSIQRLTDVNEVNPLMLLKQKPLKGNVIAKLYIKSIVKSLGNKTARAQKAFTRRLGKNISKYIYKKLPLKQKFQYQQSFNYCVCGTAIVLKPDAAYHSKFNNTGNIFLHHMLEPYYYLIENNFPD